MKPLERQGSIFSHLEPTRPGEVFQTLALAGGTRVERIISHGQATPQGEWLFQATDEFVLLIAGSAAVLFENEREPRVLAAGDWLNIPSGVRHRVERTHPGEATIWLAVHMSAASIES